MASPHSFYGNLRDGVPAPPVDPGDLKRLWEFARTVRTKHASRQSVEGTGSIGIEPRLVAQQCSPGVNVAAVMFRCQFLQMFIQLGSLAPWLHGENPDEFLFQIFATYPVHTGQFDSDALLHHIRERSGG